MWSISVLFTFFSIFNQTFRRCATAHFNGHATSRVEDLNVALVNVNVVVMKLLTIRLFSVFYFFGYIVGVDFQVDCCLRFIRTR